MLKRKNILLLLEWYDYRIHKGVSKMARKYGWQLDCPKNLMSIPTDSGWLRDWEGDGCIAMIESEKVFNYLKAKDIPILDLGLKDYGKTFTRIVSDNPEIAKLARKHLRDLGHKEIFCLDHGNNEMFKERLNALKEDVKEDESNGCNVTVLKSATEIQNEIIYELRDIAFSRGKKLEEMSIGFFAYNDSIAAELISLCLKHGIRVPENIAIIGVDNDDLINDSLVLGLSSVDSDLEGLGAESAKLIDKLISNPNSQVNPKVYRHPPKAVITRRSTDCYAVRNPLVSNALHWIKNNFYKGIQATDVAQAMGVTQQGLQKAFTKSYIRSPGNEIRHQRVQAVAFLLRTTNAKLETIAKNTGYYSVNSLINSFRKDYNTTPGKYRSQKKHEGTN